MPFNSIVQGWCVQKEGIVANCIQEVVDIGSRESRHDMAPHREPTLPWYHWVEFSMVALTMSLGNHPKFGLNFSKSGLLGKILCGLNMDNIGPQDKLSGHSSEHI